MFDSLIKFVREAEPADLAAIEIEEIAIVSAWFDSHNGDIAITEAVADIPEKIAYWLEHSGSVHLESEGRRLQPLLRIVLDNVVTEGPARLHRSELDLLVHAHDLIKKHPDLERFERLAQFFSREYRPIKAAREKTDPVPGLSGLNPFLRIVTPDDILQAQKRSVNNFAGLKMPGRGPVYHHKGNIKVMGYVPDDCMIVAEEGSCLVHGFVFGRVAATNDCEVRDNISGVVVVSLGDVRGRNVLTNAFVVSKWGQVVVRRIERPKLVFAGRLLHVKGDTEGGRFAAPEVLVDGGAKGGEYSVSRIMTAKQIDQLSGNDCVIVLRRSITPEDYGGLVDMNAARLLSTVRRERQTRDKLRDMIRLAETERKQFATNAVHFMTGGDSLLQGLQAIVVQESRLSFCIRVLSVLDGMTRTVEEQMSAAITDSEPADDEEVRDATPLIRELKRELEDVARADQGEEMLANDLADLEEIIEDLSRAERDNSISTELLLGLRSRGEFWEEKRGSLIESLEKKMIVIEKLLGTSDVRTKNAELSEIKVLARILQAAGKRPPGDVLAHRAQSSFVKLMLRQIDARRDRIKQHEEKIHGIDEELKRLGEQLQAEAKIPLPDELDDASVSPRVEAVFGTGVTVCTDKCLLDDLRTTSVISVGASESRQSFVRSHHRIVLEQSESVET